MEQPVSETPRLSLRPLTLADTTLNLPPPF